MTGSDQGFHESISIEANCSLSKPFEELQFGGKDEVLNNLERSGHLLRNDTGRSININEIETNIYIVKC